MLSLLILFYGSLAFATITKTNSNQPEFLFVQTAGSAIVSAVPNKKNTYILILKNVNPYVTYFTERPNRIAGLMPLEEFLKYWQEGKNNFSKNIPNASLVAYHKKKFKGKQLVQHVIELTAPTYNANKKTVTYIIHDLGGDGNTLPMLARYSQIALFVDQACMSCTL